MNIRAYRKGDEHEIMAFDARELPSEENPRTLENWSWKFSDSNPAGHALIWIAEHNQQMVAHFAAIPYRLKVFDEELKASHTIGALVESKYQKRGLLMLVADKLWQEQANNQIPFTWGFPNQRAYQLHLSYLGYVDLINFDEWNLKKSNFVERETPPAFQRIQIFDDDVDALWRDCAPDYDIAVVRNKSYLNWRYLQRPDWQYFPYGIYEQNVIKGYVVLKLYREKQRQRGHIIDIFAHRNDEQTLSQLIDGSLNFFSDRDVDEITVWMWGNPLIETLFYQRAFTKISLERPLVLRRNLEHRYHNQILDSSRWYFTMGDSTEIF
ncbi:GNAT family N-acetyltransferase [candidate division CSSED10-310 bacterium]|uniref:GNAT family N-acetyltransferase n=1 Tax=candidate division CSSED10-310 bacterium TaxID=2855610 RepID=A0ABV6Z5S0_UNCC1